LSLKLVACNAAAVSSYTALHSDLADSAVARVCHFV